MKDLYYVNDRQERIGPIDLSEILMHPINANTLVWRKGMAQWVPAGSIPEVSEYLAPTSSFGPTSATPPMPPVGNAGNQPYYSGESGKPSSYLWLAILTTIFCCIPFGIVAIVFASKVDGLWARGDVDGARNNSKRALNWSLAGIVGSILVWIIYITAVIAMFGSLEYLIEASSNPYEFYELID